VLPLRPARGGEGRVAGEEEEWLPLCGQCPEVPADRRREKLTD